jgi:hypothetical protein
VVRFTIVVEVKFSIGVEVGVRVVVVVGAYIVVRTEIAYLTFGVLQGIVSS